MTHETARANLAEILAQHSAETVAELARNAYKYTDCGAAVGARIHTGDFTAGRWVYGDSDLRKLTSDDLITALSISSIVEGVEQTTDIHVVDLLECETADDAAVAYSAALDAVEHEASAIWNNTHGCPTCAKHWGNYGEFGPIEGDDGQTPVWDECPNCKGHGSVI